MNHIKSKSLFKRNKKYKGKRQLSQAPPKEKIFINKENEYIFSHKNALEILLNIIKKNQIALISEFSLEDKNTILLKQRLYLLKDKLNILLKEKIRKKIQLEEENETLKNEGIENIFSTYEVVEEKKAKNFKEKEKIYPSELDKIKTLNFEIENKIKKIDFLIKRKKKIAKSKPDEIGDLEIYCGYKKKTNQKARDIFTNSMKKVNEEYNEINGKSERVEIEKGLIKNQISYLKKRKEERMGLKCLSSENIFIKNILEVPNANSNKNKNERIKRKSFQEECLTTENKLKTIRCLSFDQLNQNNILNEEQKNDDNEDIKEKGSFHSSLYTDNLSKEDSFELDIEEENDDKIPSSNISNDNINTEYNSDKAMSNDAKNNNLENEKINQCDNFIF